MRRVLIIGTGTVILLLVLSQLLLPGYLEGRVADRLTKGGGHADVTLKAFPALTLLAKSGSEAKVRGNGLNLPVNEGGNKPLDALDGFDKVDLVITASTAGPFHIGTLTLERAGDHDAYSTRLDGTTTGRDLATYAGGQLGGPLGSLLGGIAAGAVYFTDSPIAIHVSASVASDGGRPAVQSVNGTIGGLPAGPLLEALAIAVGRSF
jgi:hypothetical protein